MNFRNKALTLIVATASSLSAVVAQASTSFEEAEVLASTPIYRVVETSSPSRECWQEDVVRQNRSRGNDSATSSIFGAIIGGALGNAVGHHKTNKRVGTVVGAILGGSIASDISKANARNNDGQYIETVERCRTVQNTRQEEKLVGYDVSYSYNGSQHTVRMPRDPGATVKVRVNVEPVF